MLSRNLRVSVRCDSFVGREQQVARQLLRDGAAARQHFAALQVDPERAHNAGHVDAGMRVIIGVFGGDGGFAAGRRNVAELDGRVAPLMRIADLIQHAPVPIENARGRRRGALIQRVERGQIDKQPRVNSSRAREAGGQQYEQSEFPVTTHKQ